MLVDPLPVGFRDFHSTAFINYQLNRAHSLGWADENELAQAAARIGRLDDVVGVFDELSTTAEADGRLPHALGHQRICEFFTAPSSPDKVPRYRRFRDLFDRVMADVPVARVDVPYRSGKLPTYRLASGSTTRGTVLVHGGFDSLIEEFFPVWERISRAGFDVVAFDGPGQGGALALHGLHFEHDWERPVGAILDHFSLPSAALVGISMGGYWAVRAAAYEPRITQVVSWPPVYDWMYQLGPALRWMARVMIRWRRFMNWSIRLRMRMFPILHHAVTQAMYLVGGTEPMHAVDWLLGMNHLHLTSGGVHQDVLVMSGDNDHFQPPKLAHLQLEALTAARSVETRAFTAAEHADNHCQMGNLNLACEVVTDWLLRHVPNPRLAP